VREPAPRPICEHTRSRFENIPAEVLDGLGAVPRHHPGENILDHVFDFGIVANPAAEIR